MKGVEQISSTYFDRLQVKENTLRQQIPELKEGELTVLVMFMMCFVCLLLGIMIGEYTRDGDE